MRIVPQHLQTRTAVVIAAAFFIFLSLVFLTAFFSIRSSLISRTDNEVRAEMNDLAVHLYPGISSADAASLAATHRRIGESELHYALEEVRGNDIVPILSEIRGDKSETRIIRLRSKQFILTVAYSLLSLEEAQESVLEVFASYLLVGLILAIVAGIILSRYLIGPIGSLAHSARAISVESPGSKARLPVPSSILEVAELATSINSLLDARERALEQQRRFAADAAHELRTPLTVLKGELEVELRATSDPAQLELLHSNLEEVERLIDTVQDLLELAEIESEPRRSFHDEKTPLRSAIHYAAERLYPLAKAKAISLELPSQDIIIRARETRITRLIYNLVLNAIQHSEVGSKINVNLCQTEQGAKIEIEDFGKGMSQERMHRLFERFHSDSAKSLDGAGLGLSIVKSISDHYGFTIEVQSAAQGTTVFIRIPASMIASIIDG